MQKKIKRKINEYYVNGQVKMVVEYKGDWSTGDFIVKKHYDYNESGRLMKFKDQFERLDFLDKNYKKVINLDRKEFDKPWKCALAIKKIIRVKIFYFSFKNSLFDNNTFSFKDFKSFVRSPFINIGY